MIRKLFIDSRHRSSGDHNNFTVELPRDVDTSRTSSMYLGSCSFSNTMETVSVGVNDRLFVVADTGRVEVQDANGFLYVLIGSPPDGNPRTAARIPVPPGSYDGPGLAAQLTTLMRNYTDGVGKPTATVTFSDGALTFYDRLQDGAELHYLLPSGRQLRDPTWKATVWDPAQLLWRPRYDIANPMDLNRSLGLSWGTQYLSPFRTGQLQSKIASILPVPVGQYSGASLAAALQSLLQTKVTATVGFDSEGRLTVTSTVPLQFPTDAELRDSAWRGLHWDAYDELQQPYDTTYPRDLNGQLFFPSPSAPALTTVTGNVDLAPYREVYLHSSLSNNLTLKTSGERDCIARIPIDVDYGYVVSFRHLGPSDALSASDVHFRNVSFSFRDWRGQLVPIDQPVAIELVIVDSDPFAA
jgi:hypothetical protein